VLPRYHATTPSARGFTVLPAIDLRGGRVVRLEQGDFTRETAFSDDPLAVALGFADTGARWLHLVDLDAARDGSSGHAPVITAIVAAIGEQVSVEIAGGLRSIEAVADALARGAARAVVGTAALRDPGFVGGLVAAHGADRIAVALDVRDGLAVGHGWVPGSPGVPVETALATLADAGVTTFEVTAIDRGAIIASAGIASVADLAAVRSIGCAGAIVGRALYDGSLSLADAFSMERA
jgi:phosphoribosylformimino-5-aminoimidazole carboxamide ribotide isomerase